MNKAVIYFLALFLLAITTACGSSSSDEPDNPEQEYTGPWEIVYYESYYGIHNETQEFQKWFDAHYKWFDSAKLVNGDKTWIFTSQDDYIIWDDYKEWKKGEICWVEELNGAKEDEVKKMIKDIESYSIPLNDKLYFDKFEASYKKLK